MPNRSFNGIVGRPNLKWTEETMRRLWDQFKHDASKCYLNNQEHANIIKTIAIKYVPPFSIEDRI